MPQKRDRAISNDDADAAQATADVAAAIRRGLALEANSTMLCLYRKR